MATVHDRQPVVGVRVVLSPAIVEKLVVLGVDPRRARLLVHQVGADIDVQALLQLLLQEPEGGAAVEPGGLELRLEGGDGGLDLRQRLRERRPALERRVEHAGE